MKQTNKQTKTENKTQIAETKIRTFSQTLITNTKEDQK